MWDWRESHPASPLYYITAEGYGSKLQREKEEELGRVPRESNVYFSWMSAVDLRLLRLAFNPTW